MIRSCCSFLVVGLLAAGCADLARAQPKERPDRSRGQKPGRQAGERPDRFLQWDKNKDGKLTRDELPQQLRGNFGRVDTDKDGFISRDEHNAVVRRNRQRRGAGTQQPPKIEGVEAKMDIPYADTDNPKQRLDLFLPKERKTDKPLPVVAFIHGGGWRGGDKRGGGRMVAPYVQTGDYAGASIGYRLSGEAIWPAQIHDCKAAVRWLKAHAKEHNLDPDRIAVWGSSAGGHLVAMLGVTGDVKELEGKLGEHTDQDSRVAYVVDWFGPTELLTMKDFPSNIDHDNAKSPESLLIGGAIQENKEAAKNASPITYVSKGDSPILIMHGTEDKLVPYKQSEQFDAALAKAKVPSVFIPIQGAGHGRFNNPEVNRRVTQFLERHLLGKKVDISTDPITVRAAPRKPRR